MNECDNELDDDDDGIIDWRLFFGGDRGCASPFDESEHGSHACDDGLDNDGDGLADYRRFGIGDPGCNWPDDNEE